MNKILLIIISALLIVFNVKAQTHIAIQDSTLSHLNKSKITSGALYDRVYSWANLDTYNNDTIDYNFVKQAWHELYLSKYNTTGLSTTAVKNICKANTRNDNVITVGYIDYNFQHIDTNAFASGALVIHPNDSLPRDGDTTLNPYRTKNIVLPFIGIGHISDANPYFYFDPSIKLVNASQKIIKSIKISNANGSITLLPGDRKPLPFINTAKGKVSLRIEVSFDGIPTYTFPYTIGYGAADLLTHSVTTGECNSGSIPKEIWSGSSLTFQGYDESVATQGKGEYKIFYKLNDILGTGCEQELTKPIIILDGFDPEDGRKITAEIDEETGEYIEGIWDLLSYGGAEHFGDSLRLKGYDVIVLNFPEYNDAVHTGGQERDGGTDYIERNAMVLTKLIQNVNDSLINNGVALANRELVIV